MSSRLTCHSFSDWLTSQAAPDKSALPPEFWRAASILDPAFVSGEPISSGALPAWLGGYGVLGEYAPDRPIDPVSWSTTTTVDIAGWTEVVIQEGRCVLSDVNSGPVAAVNASINWVLESVNQDTSRLDNYRSESNDLNTCGCLDSSERNDSSFSCSSFNEVTK